MSLLVLALRFWPLLLVLVLALLLFQCFMSWTGVRINTPA
ncbi:hypothetical protein NCGM1179_3184 [Pseudomonas aeruginosa NCMG1179]|nr:hypothetical protein NCGM1179_3184 [Pseudomonas aeruginosa NCMG1179]